MIKQKNAVRRFFVFAYSQLARTGIFPAYHPSLNIAANGSQGVHPCISGIPSIPGYRRKWLPGSASMHFRHTIHPWISPEMAPRERIHAFPAYHPSLDIAGNGSQGAHPCISGIPSIPRYKKTSRGWFCLSKKNNQAAFASRQNSVCIKPITASASLLFIL